MRREVIVGWVDGIVERLSHGSKLEFVIARQPSIIVTPACYLDKDIINISTYYNVIEPPAGMLLNVRSEEEMAFILSHELSHAVLGHGIAAMECIMTRQCFREDLWLDQEREADINALKMVVNAGYDPKSAIRVFKWLKKQAHDNGDGFHGTYEERFERLKLIIRNEWYKQGSRGSSLPENARQELKALAGRSGN